MAEVEEVVKSIPMVREEVEEGVVNLKMMVKMVEVEEVVNLA